MAEIMIKMGVNAPKSDVDGVLKLFQYVFQQDSSKDNSVFEFCAYNEEFSDGAIGVLASMSIILNYIGKDGSENTFVEYILHSFKRINKNGKSALLVTISPTGRKLIRLVYEQRNRENNEEERSNYIQKMAEEFGLV